MDLATIERLARDYPERFRGGQVDHHRPLGQTVTSAEAWERARRCLADDNPARAAFWAGYAAAGDGQ